MSLSTSTDVIAGVPGPAAAFALGPVRQISFVVGDLDAELPTYTAMFGAFTVRRAVVDPAMVTYRGQPCVATLRIGIAWWEGTEIELVAVEDGEHAASEHLRDHGPGLHHLGFHVDDLRAKVDEVTAAGFETIIEGSVPNGPAFAYVQPPPALGHSVFELVQPAIRDASTPRTDRSTP